MNGSRKRGRTAALLVFALGALALLALPGMAAAKAKDRNHDRIPDRWERKHKLSLKVNQARRDQDGDQLRNRAEFRAGTNPRDADSDNDGLEDGEENAGTVASFDPETGKLTIALFGGETITGFVTEDTEIECGCGQHSSAEGEEGEVRARSGEGDGPEHDGEDDNGEDGPSHDAEDDNGEDGAGHDVGDDHGGDHGTQQGDGCTVEDLTEGAAIQEAELKVTEGRAVFEKIELGR